MDEGVDSVKKGNYVIVSVQSLEENGKIKKNKPYVVDTDGKDVFVVRELSEASTVWEIEQIDRKFYNIYNRKTDKAISLAEDSKERLTNIHVGKYKEADHTAWWSFSERWKGKFFIENKYSGMCFTICGGDSIKQKEFLGSSNSETQTWLLVRPDKPEIKTTSLSNGKVRKVYSATLTGSCDEWIAIEWSLANDSGRLPNGLELSSDGKISGTPTEAGEFDIKVVAENEFGQTTADYTLVISGDVDLPVRHIELDKSSISLVEGDTTSLTATILPEDATNKTLKWTSDDTNVATVDETGKVTAVSEGITTVTATSTDGSNMSASCKVIVKSPESTDEYLVSGTYEDITWSIDMNGKLTVKGTGEFRASEDAKVLEARSPWYPYREQIKKAEIILKDTNDLSGMMHGCNNMTEISLSRLDTSKATNMAGMFYRCGNLKAIDLSGFDTSAVTSINAMFSGCSSLSSLDISMFDVSNVVSMVDVFGNCSSLKSVKAPANLNKDLDLPDSNWKNTATGETGLSVIPAHTTTGTLFIWDNTPAPGPVTDDWGDLEDLPDIKKIFASVKEVPVDIWYAFEGDSKYYNSGSKSQITQVKKDYTGGRIMFSDEIYVFYGTERLAEGRDYRVIYSNNVEPAQASESGSSPAVTIKAMGGFYKGSAEFKFTISESQMTSAEDVMIACLNTEPEYTGSRLTLSDLYVADPKLGYDKVTLYTEKDGSRTELIENKDYTFDEKQLRRVGTFNLEFRLTDNYKGTVVSKQITVKPYDVTKHIKAGDSKVSIKVEEKTDYNKAGAEPKVTVTFNGTELREGVDYKVSYSRNKKLVSNAKIKFSFTGYFKGKVKEYFETVKKDVSKLTLYADDLKWRDRPGNFKTLPKVLDNGKPVSKLRDIEKYKLNSCEFYYAEGDKKDQKIGDSETVPANTLIEVRVNIKSRQKGGYTGETLLKCQYRVYGAENNIRKAKVSTTPIDYREGEPIIPVNGIDFKIVMPGTDKSLDSECIEIVSVTKNRFIGTATVQVRGKNGYGGSKTFRIKIVKRRM